MTIAPKNKETIFHDSKSLLQNEGEQWIGKSNKYDATIGSYDDAEVYELISIFMLRLIGNKYNPIQNDKLVVFQNTSGWQSEKIYIYI